MNWFFSRRFLPESPDLRYDHESALVGNDLHLFGGKDREKYFPRNEIWVANVREKLNWICCMTKGWVPPPCLGARCVVIDGIIYSYGGVKEGGGFLGMVYGLDPNEMKWFEVATSADRKEPLERSHCSLWKIGSRMIMFGGKGRRIPNDHLQFGALWESYANNEIYELVLDGTKQRGTWLDLELSGTRPEPRFGAAMATIDAHQGILHGGLNLSKSFADAFVINLEQKVWISVEFNLQPSSRSFHTICLISQHHFSDESCLFLVGGLSRSDKVSDHAYILFLNEKRSFKVNLASDVANVRRHTAHCFSDQEEISRLILTGGEDWNTGLKSCFLLLLLEPVLARLESQVASPNRCEITFNLLKDARGESKCELEDDNQKFILKAEKNLDSQSIDQIQYLKEELELKSKEVLDLNSRIEANRISYRREMEKSRAQCAALEEQFEIKLNFERTLEASLKEAQSSLDEFVNLLDINPSQICLTDSKLGSGAYADVILGHWLDTPVAIKKFHDLITSPRSIPLFQSEVLTASRLHHPNIIVYFGAVMKEGLPFQIVTELLEGSLSELIDASHDSDGGYLTQYEQISVSLQMTSAITYLHQLQPRSYVHGDIRPTNVLITREMNAKMGDLGAAHLLESSKSAGPLSPQYLAPERMPPTSARSSLPSDVYSLGVSLIELFTGMAPVPKERLGQLRRISQRERLYLLCSQIVSNAEDIGNRPSSDECLEKLKKEKAECVAKGHRPIKRMVKGKFTGKGRNRRHKVVLSDSFFI